MSIYVLFTGDTYYPGGGLSDIAEVVSAATDEEALARTEKRRAKVGKYQWWELVQVYPGEPREVEDE